MIVGLHKEKEKDMFLLNRNTEIRYEISKAPVIGAVEILKRDIKKVLLPGEFPQTEIRLVEVAGMEEEAFQISVEKEMVIEASDDLGFVYGLLYISEKFLGIKPFWFWMNQEIETKKVINVDIGVYDSPVYAVKYRGWFFNDEVLLTHWSIANDGVEPWRMAFEALLRCGGNMVIPGTDKVGRKNRQLAADMGLWLTHHHAEPLGAEMFARAYPEKRPSYDENKALFLKLWEESVLAQKDKKVIYALGFRGQGDCPFWSSDSSGAYNTDEKRGALISELLVLQKEIVKKHVANPIFCTNLYGEIMELYEKGFIHLDEDVIRIYADNGYGKMVTRRRDNHTVRVVALPKKEEEIATKNGIYYHVSFYDLQAANHMTMLPNSVDFVNKELNVVKEKGAMTYWIINCSNVRPHVYYLDAVSKKWKGKEISDANHSREFAADYFHNNEKIANCYAMHAKAMPKYGREEDEHAGEQLYTEHVRSIVNHLVRNQTSALNSLKWLTGDITLIEQLEVLEKIAEKYEKPLELYQEQCEKVANQLEEDEKRLFTSTLLLDVTLHVYGIQGLKIAMHACKAYLLKSYKEAFLLFGDAATCYERARKAMQHAEFGVWKGFYQNDCFADFEHTAFMLWKIMGVVREFGDNERHDDWYRDAVYEKEDRYIYTQLVLDNHMTDKELYEKMKDK